MTRSTVSLWGRNSGLGLLIAVLACALDQASKLWLLFVYDLGARGAVKILPVLDFVLIWNTGISYGLLQQNGPLGQWALLALSLFLSGCPLIISLDYVPSNTVKGQGAVHVGDFIYRPATQGAVRPREVAVPSEVIGRIF